jgi:hypothetical protein
MLNNNNKHTANNNTTSTASANSSNNTSTNSSSTANSSAIPLNIPSPNNHPQDDTDLSETCKQIARIVQIPAILSFLAILLTSKAAFAVLDGASLFNMVLVKQIYHHYLLGS